MYDDLISIVVTLYNYRQYIGSLIESVIAQSYKNWELIIVNDGSTDNPLEVILPYKVNKYNIGQFRIYNFTENKGYAVAKNYGITHTSPNSKAIVMIDADDMLTPDSLLIRKQLLDDNPNKLWCHGEVLVTHDRRGDSSDESVRWKRKYRAKLEVEGRDLTKTYCHRLIHAQSVMVRPQLHKKYGLYDESLRFSADNEMWRRVIRFGEVPAHTFELVAVYRLHAGRMCRSPYKMKHRHRVKQQIINDVERRYREGINEQNTKLWK